MTLGMLVEGKWVKEWTERDQEDDLTGCLHSFAIGLLRMVLVVLKPDVRYHLYVSLGCPWARRAVIMWKSKGLEETISLSIVDSVISEDVWKFSDYSGCIPDFINHAEYLREIYLKANPNYTGRVTVPVFGIKKLARL